MPTSTWKGDEADVAADLTEVFDTERRFDHKCTRVPLSGSNNRRTDGTSHRGDVSMPDEMNMLVECKRRKSQAHQTLLDTAKKDAVKHGIDPKHTILVTKVLRQRGYTAVLDWDLLLELFRLPGALEIFTKEPIKKVDRHTPDAPDVGCSSPANKRPRVKAKDNVQVRARTRKESPRSKEADTGGGVP